MSTTVNPLVGHAANGNPVTATLTPAELALLEGIKTGTVRTQTVKPKIATTADSFGQADAESAKPTVNCTMTVDESGNLHIVLPPMAYSQTRDTSSRSRRTVYAKGDEAIDGFIAHTDADGNLTGKMIPVTFSLTGLNLSAAARKVST